MPTVTIFTPTYNRAHTIEKLYRSLQKQTCRDFEWLIIDDGSSDNTAALFSAWEKEENDFSLRYVQKPNGGKHTAINKGTELAAGKLFFIVDSDDYLMPDAVQKVIMWEQNLPTEANAQFAGVAGARGFSPDKMIGTGSGKSYVDCSSQERANYGITGDKAEIFFTEVLKKFPFPVFEEERFVTESVVWFALGRAGYKIRWYDDIIYIGEYREDGLSNQDMGLFYRNPKGYLLAIQSDLQSLPLSFIRRFAYYAVYAQVAAQVGKTRKEAAAELQVSPITLTLASLFRNLKKGLQGKKEA